MTIPKEYNVIEGLPGLGPDIMFEVLSEMLSISNAVQFIDHPVDIINKEPDYVELIDIDGVQKKINKKEYYASTISLVQVLDNGIWSLEALFQNSEGFADTDHIATFCGG
ncbi:MAG: hypothetical protein EZS28_043869, partial [Streblomastix strix]